MAFLEVTIIKAPAKSAPSTGISVGLTKMQTAQAKLRIMIHGATFDELGFSLDDRINLLIGTGDDRGRIRLQKNRSTGAVQFSRRVFPGKSGKAGYSLNLGHRPEFVDQNQKAVACAWTRVDPATVEITLPTWALKEQRQPAVAAQPAPSPSLQQANREARERQARLGVR